MGRLRRLGAFLISKTVATAILGFLLSLFGREMLYAVPSGKELDVAVVLFLSILILMIYVLGLLDEAKRRWWEWRRFRTPIIIGVFKGYLDDSKKGLECRPMYSTKMCWLDCFEGVFSDGKKLFSAKEIFWSEISSKYAAIINPFGEIYLNKIEETSRHTRRSRDMWQTVGFFVARAGDPICYQTRYHTYDCTN